MISLMTVSIAADSDVGDEAESSMSKDIVHWFCTTRGGRLSPYLFVMNFGGNVYSRDEIRQESPAIERR